MQNSQDNHNYSKQTSTTRIKGILRRVNLTLQLYNMNRYPNIWHSIYKWNYDHNLLKNLLKITNKTLKALNKYHVFKIDYLYMVLGMGLGFIVKELQNTFEHIQKIQLKSALNNLLINHVLTNQSLSTQLKSALTQNVLKNQDIRTQVHFLLLNKVLSPQQQNINALVKKALLDALQSSFLSAIVEKELVSTIQKNTHIIGDQAFKFLISNTMAEIVARSVAPLIKSQYVQNQVSKQLKIQVNGQLKNQQTQQKLYQFLRQKVIF